MDHVGPDRREIDVEDGRSAVRAGRVERQHGAFAAVCRQQALSGRRQRQLDVGRGREDLDQGVDQRQIVLRIQRVGLRRIRHHGLGRQAHRSSVSVVTILNESDIPSSFDRRG